MVGGAQPQQGQLHNQGGPEVSRRGFVGTLAALTLLSPKHVVQAVVPGSAAVVAATTDSAGSIWSNVVNAAAAFHAPNYRLHSDLQLSDLLKEVETAEEIEGIVLQFVSRRVGKHCGYLKNLELAFAEVERSPEKSGLIRGLLDDADELRELEVARQRKVADRALDMIHSAVSHLSSDGSTLPVWLQNVRSPLKHCSVEQQQAIARLTKAELARHIDQFDWMVSGRDQRQIVLSWALEEAAGEDKDSADARAVKARRNEIRQRHGISTAYIRLVARALRSLPQVFAHSASVVSLPETGRHATIPQLAHTGCLRIPTDALELYKLVAAPGGAWLSEDHRQAYARLQLSLDRLLPEITHNAMNTHFPDYMQTDSPQRDRVEKHMRKRAERAVDRQRALLPDNLANDYY